MQTEVNLSLFSIPGRELDVVFLPMDFKVIKPSPSCDAKGLSRRHLYT